VFVTDPLTPELFFGHKRFLAYWLFFRHLFP